MSLQTRVPGVIDTVVTGMRATTGYRTPGDTGTGFPVFDGPELYLHELPNTVGYLVIGYVDDPSEPSPSSESMFAQGPMGPQHSRDETATISCLASASHGDADDGSASAIRALTVGIMGDVANYCRINPSLGLDTSGVVGGIRTRAFVTAGTMFQYLNGGVVCDWVFTITYQARV